MNPIVTSVALLAGAYLLGAVPFGLIIVRLASGVDIREAGSGNIGATNVARVAGKKLGVAVLVLDAAKGFGPTVLARVLQPETAWLHVAVGGATIAGHMFPVYLKFKGGKGVATGLGVFLAIAPYAAAAGGAAYAVLYAAFRVSSIGSLIGAAIATTVVFVQFGAGAYAWFAAAALVAIVAKHRGNIVRLIHRQEKPV